MRVGKVLENSGIGDEWTIARRIRALKTGLSGRPDRERSVLNLSFGATVLDHPFLMAHVVSRIQSIGVIVVASAGNDAMSQPVFPAALPGVIGVGALGPAGPAPFTNYGPWVTACAPGVDLVSGFFKWFGQSKPRLSGVGDMERYLVLSTDCGRSAGRLHDGTTGRDDCAGRPEPPDRLPVAHAAP